MQDLPIYMNHIHFNMFILLQNLYFSQYSEFMKNDRDQNNLSEAITCTVNIIFSRNLHIDIETGD